MTGELGARQNQLAEVEYNCKAQFDCDCSALPEIEKQLRDAAEQQLASTEITLGLRKQHDEDGL